MVRSRVFVPCLSLACLAALLTLVGVLTYRFASPFAPSDLEGATRLSLLLLVASGGASFTYCWLSPAPHSGRNAVVAGLAAVIVASVAHSLAWHDSVLVSFPSLFCPAGAALGGTAAATRRERDDAELP